METFNIPFQSTENNNSIILKLPAQNEGKAMVSRNLIFKKGFLEGLTSSHPLKNTAVAEMVML